jgi:hypothetical protein
MFLLVFRFVHSPVARPSPQQVSCGPICIILPVGVVTLVCTCRYTWWHDLAANSGKANRSLHDPVHHMNVGTCSCETVAAVQFVPQSWHCTRAPVAPQNLLCLSQIICRSSPTVKQRKQFALLETNTHSLVFDSMFVQPSSMGLSLD